MHMTTQEIMGHQIKMLRIKKGYSQTKLAEMVGYKDKTAIAKIEAGKVDLPQSKIIAFAKALNTDTSYLFDNTSDSISDNDDNTFYLYKFDELLPDYVKEIGEFLCHNPNHKRLIDASMRIEPADVDLAKAMLDKISGYSSEASLNAAHEIKGASPEDQKHDNDIMDSEDF